MTDKLPHNLLALFAPRPPLRWVPPCDFPSEQRKTAPVSAVADFLPALAAYKDQDGFVPTESWLEMKDRQKREKKEEAETLLTEIPARFNPNEDPNIRGDAFKTLMVSRLSYEANEEDLEKEFGRFGSIERIRIVRDTHAHEKGNKKRKPHRGYAFIVFERERDMRAALDSTDGIRIKDRRIKVDVERGRTVKGWKPRRLGGGLGGRGYTKSMPSRPMGQPGFGGGVRGGFRGGFGGRDRGFRGGGRSFQDRDRGFGGGPRGGDRGFAGPPQNGFSGPPANAPGGPGYGGRDRRDFSGPRGGGGHDSRDGGRSHDDRPGGGYRDGRDRNSGRQTGSNMEPIRPREPRENGGYRDRDREFDRPRDEERKRPYDGGYEDPRKLRRY